MSSQDSLRRSGESLHAEMLAGTSLTVTERVAALFLPGIVRSLQREFWNVRDTHLIDTAVEDALISYFVNPAQFDPTRSALATYLRLRARSYLLNLLSKERSHSEKQITVELDRQKPVDQMGEEADDPELLLIAHEADDEIMRDLATILLDRTDLEFVKLMMQGIRETSRFAELLGILELSFAEQVASVKRNKDRLKLTIKRSYERRGKRP